MIPDRDDQSGDEEVDLSGPGGFRIRARGYDILTVAVVVGVALMAYIMWQHMHESEASQEKIITSLDKLASSQEELSYLISLPQDAREKLRLQMPESLRRRVRDGRDAE